MRNLIGRFIDRHEPRNDWRVHAKSAGATAASVTLIGWLSAMTGLPLLLAPLGPTALVIFGQPDSTNAQPINIFAGYFIGTTIAVLAMLVVPEPWWLATLCVGLTMLIMLVLRVTHPPAAAVPLLLYGVLLAACVLLVVLGVVVHRFPPRARYPLARIPESDQA